MRGDVLEDHLSGSSHENGARDQQSTESSVTSGRITRRSLLRSVGAGIATITTTSTLVSGATDYWTVVALPDTQFYAERENRISYARDQTKWVVDNREAENIQFVTHEGDLVEHGDNETEWERIDSAMSTLDGKVPYSTLPGNHDWAIEGDRTSSSEKYQSYFGASRYEGRDWYGGAGPDEEPLNSYQYFSAGGYEFLHIALEWEPPGEVDDTSTPLGWAQRILDENRSLPTIVTTHYYLDEHSRSESLQEHNGIGNTGQEVWEKLVEPNPQVFLVLNGHIHTDDGEHHQQSTNVAGLPVFEVLADYQDYPNGGNGWMRLIQFRPGGGNDADDLIQFRTYSPSLDEYMTDDSSEFGFDVRFADRFDPASWGIATGDVDDDGDVDSDDVDRLQEYLSSRDVDIDESAADVNEDGEIDIADAVTLNNQLGEN